MCPLQKRTSRHIKSNRRILSEKKLWKTSYNCNKSRLIVIAFRILYYLRKFCQIMKILRNRLALSRSKTRVKKGNIMQPDKYPQATSHRLCQEGDRVPCLSLKPLNTSSICYLNGERISLFLVSAVRLAILFGIFLRGLSRT